MPTHLRDSIRTVWREVGGSWLMSVYDCFLLKGYSSPIFVTESALSWSWYSSKSSASQGCAWFLATCKDMRCFCNWVGTYVSWLSLIQSHLLCSLSNHCLSVCLPESAGNSLRQQGHSQRFCIVLNLLMYLGFIYSFCVFPDFNDTWHKGDLTSSGQNRAEIDERRRKNYLKKLTD